MKVKATLFFISENFATVVPAFFECGVTPVRVWSHPGSGVESPRFECGVSPVGAWSQPGSSVESGRFECESLNLPLRPSPPRDLSGRTPGSLFPLSSPPPPESEEPRVKLSHPGSWSPQPGGPPGMNGGMIGMNGETIEMIGGMIGMNGG